MYNCIIHAIFIWLLFRVLSFCPSFFFVVLILSWEYLVFTCNWKVLKLSRNVISSKISWRVPYYYLQEHPNPCYVTLVRDIIMVYCTERVTWSYDTCRKQFQEYHKLMWTYLVTVYLFSCPLIPHMSYFLSLARWAWYGCFWCFITIFGLISTKYLTF